MTVLAKQNPNTILALKTDLIQSEACFSRYLLRAVSIKAFFRSSRESWRSSEFLENERAPDDVFDAAAAAAAAVVC